MAKADIIIVGLQIRMEGRIEVRRGITSERIGISSAPAIQFHERGAGASELELMPKGNYSGRWAEGFWSSVFSLRLKDSSLLDPTVVETEKVLNGVIRALRDNV